MTPTLVEPQAFVDALEVAGVGVYFVDPSCRITFWSKGAEAVSGWSTDEVVGRRCAENILVHLDGEGKSLCAGMCPLTQAIGQQARQDVDLFMRHKGGHRVPVRVRTLPLRDADGRILGAIEVFTDTTERLAEIEKLRALEQAAYVDALTGIANRRYFEVAHKGRAHDADRVGAVFGVAIADIDHFKRVSDTWGHPAGDEVLRAVARTLTATARSLDVVARWGGEEFVMLLPCRTEDELQVALDRRRRMVAGTRTRVGDEDLVVTLSIGATIARPHEEPAATLARADRALYAAKQGGRDRVVID